jgi:uncharacterized protein (DUF2384 family)
MMAGSIEPTGAIVLKVKGRSPLAIVQRVECGLPLSSLENLVKNLSPDDERLNYRFNRARCLSSIRLNPRQSLQSTKETGFPPSPKAGISRWKLTKGRRALAFQRGPHPLLNGRQPLDVAIRTSIGADLVYELLGQALYGIAV